MTTKRRLSVKKIARTNPGVDVNKAAEAIQMLEALRSHGVQMERYGLVLPHDKGALRRRKSVTKTKYTKTK
jgi:hypothetical protein